MSLPQNELVAALFAYRKEVRDFLQGDRTARPDADLLCGSRWPIATILNAKGGDDGRGEYVAVLIEHHECENPRLFDPWYFSPMLALHLSGGRLCYHCNRKNNDPSRHYYLVFSAPAKADGKIRILRIVANTEPGIRTAQLPHDHHDYRRIVLDRLKWVKGSKPSLGRPEAISLACGLFSETWPDGLPDLPDGRAYRALLIELFALGDAMHEALSEDDPAGK